VIAFRPAQPADAGAIAAIYAPHVTHGVASFETAAPDAGEMARRIAGAGALYPWVVAVREQEVVAYAYAGPFGSREAYRWAVETSIYVAGAAQGRGTGRLLYGALLTTLRTRGFTQAVARIALPNDSSAALHAALGFALIGIHRQVGWKQDRWIDVGLWQCALAEPGLRPVLA
jgi:phosphinothricin acetyltransferase